MKYINIVLVAFGLVLVVYTFSATFWDLTAPTSQPLEITTLPATEIRSLPLSTAPAAPQRPFARRTFATRTDQTPSEPQEDVPQVRDESSVNAQTSRKPRTPERRAETSAITAGRAQTRQPSSSRRSPSSSAQIAPPAPRSSLAGGRTGSRQPRQGQGLLLPPPQGAEGAKRRARSDRASPPPVRGSMAPRR